MMKKIELNHSQVVFYPETHQYFLGEKELKGITSTLIKRAYPDTYRGIPQHILDTAAQRGTVMHQQIQLLDMLGVAMETEEVKNYARVCDENGLRVLESEYIVSDNEHYASAIDKVMVNEEGEIILVDLKRTSSIHYENVALQLSIYKRFFEMQNPHLKVSQIYVLRLREERCDFHRLEPVGGDFIDALIDADIHDRPFLAPVMAGDLPSLVRNVEDEIIEMEQESAIIRERYAALKRMLYESMERYNVKQWDSGKIKVTRVLPRRSRVFDAARFRTEHPDLFAEYQTDRETAGSIRITIAE